MTELIRDALPLLRRKGSRWTTREIAEKALPPVNGMGIRCPAGSPQHREAAAALREMARRGEVQREGRGWWRLL